MYRIMGLIFMIGGLSLAPEVFEAAERVFMELQWASQYGYSGDFTEQLVLLISPGFVMLVFFWLGWKLFFGKRKGAKKRGAARPKRQPNRMPAKNTMQKADRPKPAAPSQHETASEPRKNPFEVYEVNGKRKFFRTKLWSDKERQAEEEMSFVDQERMRERQSMEAWGLCHSEADPYANRNWENEYFQREQSVDECAAAYSGIEDPKYHKHN